MDFEIFKSTVANIKKTDSSVGGSSPYRKDLLDDVSSILDKASSWDDVSCSDLTFISLSLKMPVNEIVDGYTDRLEWLDEERPYLDAWHELRDAFWRLTGSSKWEVAALVKSLCHDPQRLRVPEE